MFDATERISTMTTPQAMPVPTAKIVLADDLDRIPITSGCYCCASLTKCQDLVFTDSTGTHNTILRLCPDHRGELGRALAYQVTFSPIDLTRGTLLTWAQFVSDVEDGNLTDDDGFGELATATHVSDHAVHPGDVEDLELRQEISGPSAGGEPASIDVSVLEHRYPWATHVLWYNQ
jgi:hypothetical protein